MLAAGAVAVVEAAAVAVAVEDHQAEGAVVRPVVEASLLEEAGLQAVPANLRVAEEAFPVPPAEQVRSLPALRAAVAVRVLLAAVPPVPQPEAAVPAPRLATAAAQDLHNCLPAEAHGGTGAVCPPNFLRAATGLPAATSPLAVATGPPGVVAASLNCLRATGRAQARAIAHRNYRAAATAESPTSLPNFLLDQARAPALEIVPRNYRRAVMPEVLPIGLRSFPQIVQAREISGTSLASQVAPWRVVCWVVQWQTVPPSFPRNGRASAMAVLPTGPRSFQQKDRASGNAREKAVALSVRRICPRVLKIAPTGETGQAIVMANGRTA
jgi:hypothetical protein